MGLNSRKWLILGEKIFLQNVLPAFGRKTEDMSAKLPDTAGGFNRVSLC